MTATIHALAKPIKPPRTYFWQIWKPGVAAADEAWVIGKLNALARGIHVIEQDIEMMLSWTFAHFDEIAADVAQVLALAGVAGLGANPYVAAAEAAATQILAVIAAAKAKSAAGASSNLGALAASTYQAVKDLQSAHVEAAKTVAAGGKAA